LVLVCSYGSHQYLRLLQYVPNTFVHALEILEILSAKETLIGGQLSLLGSGVHFRQQKVSVDEDDECRLISFLMGSLIAFKLS
jgi:hypothetical protein